MNSRKNNFSAMAIFVPPNRKTNSFEWNSSLPTLIIRLLFPSQQSNPGANPHNISNCQGLSSGGPDGEEDLWRGHSIAALRRRASELNQTMPSYLHAHNYDHHNSVYWLQLFKWTVENENVFV